MKKCFIKMSIKKQLYFGVCGISLSFGCLAFLLALFASYKIFLDYNENLKLLFNEMDSNIVSLNGENADLFGQLLFNQGKFETFLLRNYFQSLSEDFGKNVIKNITVNSTVVNSHFISYNDNSTHCEEENSQCFFTFSKENVEMNNLTKKILYYLLPIVDISIDTFSLSKDKYKIFNKFHYYDSESKTYVSYKYKKTDVENNFASSESGEELITNCINIFINEIPNIEKLNEIKIENIYYEKLFNQNVFSIYAALHIDPFYKQNTEIMHFSSFNFNLESNKKVDKNEIKIDNLKNYIGFDSILSTLALFSLTSLQRNNGVYFYILNSDLTNTVSKSICKLSDYINMTYSNLSEQDKDMTKLNSEKLNLNENQIYSLKECLGNSESVALLLKDINLDISFKIMATLSFYNNKRDINKEIISKIFRVPTPSKYIKNFIKTKFLFTYNMYFFIIKISNNMIVLEKIIDRLSNKAIVFLLFFVFIFWIIIYIFVFICLYSENDQISSPIKKLVKNISISQDNNNGINLENIYYKEDKDINDLFQLCQNLIRGGFKEKIEYKKKNNLNIYNNISRVKTNNMIINEYDIIQQRNQKYKKIFDKEEKISDKREKISNKEEKISSKKKKTSFNQEEFLREIYKKYESKELEQKISDFTNSKIEKLRTNKKEEINKADNDEYKMFYLINEEINDYLPINNLHKFYSEEFTKKEIKKKRKQEV